jgi:hypothetical protein
LIGVALVIALGVGIFAASRNVRSTQPGKTSPQAEAQKTEQTKKANDKTLNKPPQTRDWSGLQSGEIIVEKSGSGRLVYAVGTIHNKSNRQRFGVKVELDLYDDQNARIGSATDYAQVIEPGKDWKFKALVTEPKAVRAKMAAITEN